MNGGMNSEAIVYALPFGKIETFCVDSIKEKKERKKNYTSRNEKYNRDDDGFSLR